MAQTYEDWKKSYESMNATQKQQYADILKTKGSDYIGNQYANRYVSEMWGNKPTSTTASTPANTTPTSISTTTAKTNTTSVVSKPEYQWQGWTTTKDPSSSPYVNQWQGQYTYNPQSWYYEVNKSWTTTPTATTTAKSTSSDLSNYWNNLSYEQQQSALNNNPNLKSNLASRWLTIKPAPTNNNVNTQKQNDGNWDYQDNSQARMDEIANNLNQYRITNPDLFDDWSSFYNFFIAWKWRTPEQEKFLTDYYNNMKKYNQYDNMSSDDVWYWLAHGSVSEDYLNYIKNIDPQRYAEIQWARKDAETQIMNESYLEKTAQQAGMAWDWYKWSVDNWFFVDENKDWIDDRYYVEPSEEEKKLVEENSEYEAERLKLNNALKNLQSDLTEQYPDADLSTIMLLTSDRWNKIQKALDTLSVGQTKVQWTINYLQWERKSQMQAGKDSVALLQKDYWMYYDYTPQWMAELAQAQYAATNVTLDQADNWTDTQKQMALQSVLDDYYAKYWDIIQRSEAQVINDVMAYAKKNGVSLSQALEDNFLKFLRQKPEFATLSSGWLSPTVSFEKVWDTWYVFTVNPDGTYSLESVWWVAIWSWVAWWTYNNDTLVMNFTESWMKWAWLKNNNPWNITDSNVWEVWRNGKFAVFETPEDWFDALVAKIQNAQNGNSKNYPATATLYEFFAKYAPASDNNNPKAYAESVAKQLGVSANTQIKDLDTVKFAAAIAKHDSWYNYDTYWMFRWWSGDNNNWYDPLLVDFFKKDPTKLTKDQWAKLKNMWYDERTYLSMRNNYLQGLAKEPDASTVDILDKLWYLMVNYPWREELIASKITQYTPWDYGSSIWTYRRYLDFITQNLTMDNLMKMKQNWATFGSLTEWEWPRIQDSASALAPQMWEEEYKQELLNIYNSYAKNAWMWELTLNDINNMYGWNSKSWWTNIKPMKWMGNSNVQVNNWDIDYDAVFASL